MKIIKEPAKNWSVQHLSELHVRVRSQRYRPLLRWKRIRQVLLSNVQLQNLSTKWYRSRPRPRCCYWPQPQYQRALTKMFFVHTYIATVDAKQDTAKNEEAALQKALRIMRDPKSPKSTSIKVYDFEGRLCYEYFWREGKIFESKPLKRQTVIGNYIWKQCLYYTSSNRSNQLLVTATSSLKSMTVSSIPHTRKEYQESFNWHQVCCLGWQWLIQKQRSSLCQQTLTKESFTAGLQSVHCKEICHPWRITVNKTGTSRIDAKQNFVRNIHSCNLHCIDWRLLHCHVLFGLTQWKRADTLNLSKNERKLFQ